MTDERTAVVIHLTAGQEADATAFPEVLAAIPDGCEATFAVADKGYDSDAIRVALMDAGFSPVIPSRSNRVHPVPLDKGLYRERNRAERWVGKLKQFRGIATRYDKLADSFLAFLHLAAAFVMIR